MTLTVFVVDDDPSVRRGVGRLARSAGYNVETFASAEEFLNRPPTSEPCCLVLDVYMPWLTGLELQAVINRGDDNIPIVFITGHGDGPMSVRAMKAGAVDSLQNPSTIATCWTRSNVRSHSTWGIGCERRKSPKSVSA